MKLTAGAPAFVALALGACAPSPTEGRVGVATAPVVHDSDDRRQYYELADPTWQTLARDTAVAMFEEGPLSSLRGRTDLEALRLGARTGQCEDEPFALEPAAAFCSGVLVAPSLVLTASHCVRRVRCDAIRFVFGYYYAAPAELSTIGDADVYRCAEVVARGEPAASGYGEDYALVRLERAVVERSPVADVREASEPLFSGERLVVVGFGQGLPLKVDDGGAVVDARTEAGDYFVASTDTFHGNSGSGVFDAEYRLVGVHTGGASDYVAGGTCSRLARRDGDHAEERAVYAVRALRRACAENEGGCAMEPGESASGVSVRGPGCALASPPASTARAAWALLAFGVAFGWWVRRASPSAPATLRERGVDAIDRDPLGRSGVHGLRTAEPWRG